MNEIEERDECSAEIRVRPSYGINWPARIIIFRLGITVVSAMIMFTDVSEGVSFFKSLFVFCSSLLLTTLGLISQGWKQHLHNSIQGILFIYTFIGILGLVNLLQIRLIDNIAYMHFNPLGPISDIPIQLNLLFYILLFTISMLSGVQYMNVYQAEAKVKRK